MKEETLQLMLQKYKSKEITMNNYMSKFGYSRRNGKMIRDIQPTKTE